ncbi:MAG: type I restriction enzyme HsdR N-terminal domain-containing protein [Bacteroidetes bacterium]|nr:type I restriction enzyme HsdR N-terminal domain-containing protein [Bacteroidota bacterium]
MIDRVPTLAGVLKKIQELSNRLKKYKNKSLSEANTENFFIRPLFEALGYYSSNPETFSSQYHANPRDTKSGWVDIALKKQGHLIIFIEGKKLGESLDNNNYVNQIKHYFNGVLEVKFVILTNGNEYRFYTDLENTNILDNEPFFVFKINDADQESIEFLLRFSYHDFDSSKLKELALRNARRDKIYDFLKEQSISPTPEFISFLSKTIFGAAKSDIKKDVIKALPDAFSRLIQSVKHDLPGPSNQIELKDETVEVINTNEELNLFEIKKVTYTKLDYFRFENEKIDGTWADMYVHVLDKLCQRDYSKLLNISRKHKGFKITNESSISKQWQHPRKIQPGYYIKTGYSTKQKVGYLEEVLKSFNMKDSLYVKLQGKEVKIKAPSYPLI